MHAKSESQNTEEKILKAAEQEFLEKGYGGARTTAIASAAGVTHAMLHYYFRTKENLFQRIITEKISRLKGMMQTPMLNDEIPFQEKISLTIETHLDFLYENPDLPRFLLSVMSSVPEWEQYIKQKVGESSEVIVRLLQQEIDRNAEAGICRKTDAKMLILDIVSLNVFSFVASPLASAVLGDINSPEFIKQRKENNIAIILNKLKP